MINRAGIGDNRVTDFCTREDIPILAEIPDDRRIAEACSRGEVFAAADSGFAKQLRLMTGDLRRLAFAPSGSFEIPTPRVVAP